MKLKIFILVLLIGFINNKVEAQTCEEAMEAAIKLYNEGKIEDAINEGKMACKRCKGDEKYTISIVNLAVFYKTQNNFVKAKSLFKEAFGLYRNTGDTTSIDYAVLLDNLSSLYAAQGNIIEAEQLSKKALVIFKMMLGETDENYTTCLNGLANLYQRNGDYAKAEPIYLQIISTIKTVKGETSSDYAICLNNLALLYFTNGYYQKAEFQYNQILKIMKSNLGERHPTVALTLTNVASINIKQGKINQAEELLRTSLDIQKTTIGETHLDYANTLFGLGEVFNLRGEYKKAESVFIQSLNIKQKILGENHSEIASVLISIAANCQNKADYYSSEMFYNKAISICINALGNDHPIYAIALNGLANLYITQGNYSSGETLLIQSMQIIKKQFGIKHSDYGQSLFNLGKLYQLQGDFVKAENLFEQAISIIKESLGENHQQYASCISSLAELEQLKGKLGKAESHYLQVLEIYKKAFGSNHPEYANALQKLGDLYRFQNKYEKAEELLLETSNVLKLTLGSNHIDYAHSLNSLGDLYCAMGNYMQARDYYNKALDIQKIGLGEKHPFYSSTLSNLALSFELQNNFRDADIYSKKYFSISAFNQQYMLSYLSTNQAIEYLNKEIYHTEAINSQIINYPASSLKDSMLNYTYFIKGALMQNSNRLSKAVNNNTDAKVQENGATYKDKKRYIAQLYQLPIDKQIELASTQEEADKLEKWLMQNVPEFKEALNYNKIRWQDVQQNLKPNEAAIEFVNFRYQNKKWTDTIIYAAYIVKKGIQHPIFISCFNESELEALLNKNNGSEDISILYNASAANASNKLYDLIWQPLDSVLQGIRTIYISPSGLLHKISFAALLSPSNKRLMKLYELHVMNNTRALAENKKAISEPTSVALLGGIDYDLEATNNLPNTDVAVLTENGIKTLRNGSMSAWSYLAATNKEVEDLNLLLRTNNKIATTYTGTNATEELIKSMGLGKTRVPSILHFATHGYALAEPKQPKYEDNQFRKEKNMPLFYVSEDAFTRSGLILAGANKMWSTGKPFTNKEDGILTAREIMELDLSACQLAVLSACETGLGKLSGNEGVDGLEKAFKMAGVKNTIVSLWPVPDAETREFMQLFYTNWLAKKMDMYAAFSATQTTMSSKYDVQKWGAFVLMQ